MTKYILICIAVIMLFALQVGLFSHARILGAIPNILLAFVVVSSLEKDSNEMFGIALFSGILMDAYSAFYVGTYTLGFLLIAGCIRMIVNFLSMNDIPAKYISVALAGACVALALWVWGYNALLVRWQIAEVAVSFSMIWKQLVPEILYSLALLYPVFWMAGALKEFIIRLDDKRRLVG